VENVIAAAAPEKKALSWDLKTRLRTFTMVFALLVIWAIFELVTGGAFLQARNLSNLFRQMAVTGILASGMVLVIVAGHIDLSVGSVVCFLGALLTVFNTNHGWTPTEAFLLTLAVGAAIGLAQGYLASYQRIPAFIVTLGGMMVFRGASMWVTGASTIPLRENWIQSIGTSYLGAGAGWAVCAAAIAVSCLQLWRSHASSVRHGVETGSTLAVLIKMAALAAGMAGFMAVMASYQGIPVPVLVMGAIMVLLHLAATRTTWGRHIYAIGGNVEAAHVSGIAVRAKTLSIFALMGILSAVGGVVLTARVGSASPDAGQLLELDAIASCVIGGTSLMGGKGSILGAILGALVMESLNNGMSMANMEPYWQYVIKGLVLVAAVWADIASQDRR
jgi:D-xylose transport system permease protein